MQLDPDGEAPAFYTEFDAESSILRVVNDKGIALAQISGVFAHRVNNAVSRLDLKDASLVASSVYLFGILDGIGGCLAGGVAVWDPPMPPPIAN